MSLVLTLLPLLAAGQFGTITLRVNDQTTVEIGAGSCGTNLTGSWTTALSGGVCSSMQLWVTDGDCGDAPVAGDLVLPEVSRTTLSLSPSQMGTVLIPVNDLPYFTKNRADGGASCGATGLDKTHKWCAAVSTSFDVQCFNKSSTHATEPVTIVYDTAPPGKPSLTGEALDSSAALTISVDSETSSVDIQQRAAGAADFTKVRTVSNTALNTTIDGLMNGTAYEFRVIAIDASNNASAPSEPITLTPQESQGFWAACRQAKCAASQGCSAAGGGLSLMALAVIMMLARRNRR